MTAMLRPPVDDPILRRFHAALSDLYGNRLERVVLFGSRARGDAREDSDYDVAVFIKIWARSGTRSIGSSMSRPISCVTPGP
jgi:predicted nucleotidyltransferase